MPDLLHDSIFDACFALSPLTDFIDIIDRAGSGDTGGIMDIYPTFFWCYLALLAGITTINIISILLKRRRTSSQGEHQRSSGVSAAENTRQTCLPARKETQFVSGEA